MIVASGVRPRHGVRECSMVAKRIPSDARAAISFCWPLKIGCMLRRYERRLHIRVKIAREMEAVGYECVGMS